ncbi:outer membrane protein assembly factor BamB [Acidithiobacillus ferrooxidans F221]|uniref:outer membrane protein assembly factor BamB n=1 Tax=Acidithiobacillus ferrooxidans TaxID=920 RepID=UPI001C075D97|nr:outer membrane protein assembly factor BamB [Acidithiobacillus ferrooxidans]MBU2809434.1 outer membrane protein assembly factor BamB [Acidithiobacillus ferrooxidans F221]
MSQRHFSRALGRMVALGAVATLLNGCGILSWFHSTPSPKTPPPLAKGMDKVSFSTEWQARLYGIWQVNPYQGTLIAHGKGQIVVADASGRLVSLTDGGHQMWTRSLDGRTARGPTLANGVVYTGTDTGKVYAFTAKDGHPLWAIQLSSEVLTPVVAAGDHLLVQTVDGHLWALDPNNGKVQWTFSMNQPTLILRAVATPTVRDGVVYAGFADGTVVALSLGSGAELWRAQVALPHGSNELARMVDVAASPVVAGGQVITAAYQGNLAAYALQGGTQNWSIPMSVYQTPVLEDGHLLVADADGRISSVDPASGNVLWRNDRLSGHYLTGFGLCGGSLLATDNAGYLYVIDPRTGHRIGQTRLSDSGIQSTPVCLGSGQILALSDAGTLYRIHLAKR